MSKNIFIFIIQESLLYNSYPDLFDFLNRNLKKYKATHLRFAFTLMDEVEKFAQEKGYRFVEVTLVEGREVNAKGIPVGKIQKFGKIELLDDNERISGIKRWFNTYYLPVIFNSNKNIKTKLTSKKRSISSMNWIGKRSIEKFCNCLIEKEVISCKKEDFIDLFKGKIFKGNNRIKWLLGKTELFVFLRELKSRKMVEYADKDLNKIVFNTFSQKSGMPYKLEYLRTSKSQARNISISSNYLLEGIIDDFSKSV